MKKKILNTFVVQGQDISCFARMLGGMEPGNKDSKEYGLWKSIIGASAILFVDLLTYKEFMEIVEE